jgi:hypothetical protein
MQKILSSMMAAIGWLAWGEGAAECQGFDWFSDSGQNHACATPYCIQLGGELWHSVAQHYAPYQAVKAVAEHLP